MTRFLTALPGLGCVRAWKFRVTDGEHKPVLQQLDGRHHFEITSMFCNFPPAFGLPYSTNSSTQRKVENTFVTKRDKITTQ